MFMEPPSREKIIRCTARKIAQCSRSWMGGAAVRPAIPIILPRRLAHYVDISSIVSFSSDESGIHHPRLLHTLRGGQVPSLHRYPQGQGQANCGKLPQRPRQVRILVYSHLHTHAHTYIFTPIFTQVCTQVRGLNVDGICNSFCRDGDAALVTNFESELSSAEYARMYQADNLTGGHAIMLGADDASRKAATDALGVYPGGIQLGGGVNSDNAMGWLDAGASHVIVTSFVFRDGQLDRDRLNDLVKLVGRNRLVLDLSCRKRDGQYYVVTDRWQKFTDYAITPSCLEELSTCCDEFLVHGVDVEGMKMGIDEELIAQLGRWSPLPVTYAGGATTMGDLERVKIAGDGRVDITVGSALDIFGGQLPYKQVVEWHNKNQQQAR